MRSHTRLDLWMLLPLLVFFIRVAPALAAAPDLGACAEPDPEHAIAACTALLQQPGPVPPRVTVAILQHRAGAYVKMRDADRALADCEAALHLAPKNPFVHNVGGVAYRLKGEYDRAIAEHDTAISLTPSQAQFFYTRGLAYRWKGDYDRAIADYSRAIALNPSHALAYGARAFAYRMQLDFPHALADHEAEMRLTPQTPAP
jgi:tetratricopeptide (TPR) repeat protein